MPYTPEQRKALMRQCKTLFSGFARPTPAETFRSLADWCDTHDVDTDAYGNGRALAAFEQKIAALLGKEAAVFMPSGKMAQLVALKIWTERAGLPRFAMHPTSHLELHESRSYASLLRLEGVLAGDWNRPLTAADLAAIAEPVAALLVELPIREAGGQLPSWEDLLALRDAARARGASLHMDGARLWECQPYYGRTYAELAAPFDSVYVSVYKLIGGISGALLAGDAAFVAQARLWQRRFGGELPQVSPFLAAAAMHFDTRLARIPDYYRYALALAEALGTLPGLRVNPARPHTPMMHLHFDAPAEAVLAARDAIAEEERCWVIGYCVDSRVPGWSSTELVVGDNLLALDIETVRGYFDTLMRRARA
jgi:threonine aldolase